MSVTIMANPITTGTRRLTTLGSVWGVPMTLGTAPDQDTIDELVAAGYGNESVHTLVVQGATNEQLQSLPYPADIDTMAAALATLMNQLGGASPAPGQPVTSARSYPASAVPTAIGMLDLTSKADWDKAAGYLNTVLQLVQQVSAANPSAPDVVANKQQLNSIVQQFSAYYQQTVGSPSGVQTLSGLGIFGVDDLIILAVIGIIAAAVSIYQWASTRKAQAAAQVQVSTNATNASNAALTAANTQASSLNAQAAELIKYANSLPASQSKQAGELRTQAANLQNQATGVVNSAISTAALASAPSLTNWNVWLQSNAGLLIGGLAAIVIIPSLLSMSRRR